jgi:ABC-type oligopeptide transport system ATPase subunit
MLARVTAVVGPSGSGKSSLLRILACVDRPTAGSVRVGGVDVAALTARERRRVRRELVGYVFQRPADNLLPGVPPGAVDNRRPFLPGWGSLPHRGTWHRKVRLGRAQGPGEPGRR